MMADPAQILPRDERILLIVDGVEAIYGDAVLALRGVSFSKCRKARSWRFSAPMAPERAPR